MDSIAKYFGQELKWYQPHAMEMNYELRHQDLQVASLRFRSAFGSLATGESGDGCWTFKRIGFWQTRVTVRACNAHENLAIYQNNTWSNGGSLEFPDGRKYHANTNFWMTEYSFTAESDLPLVKFRQIGGIVHASAMVEIQPGAVALPELPWLVLLGWYLTVMMNMDSSAAVAVMTP